MAHEQQLAAVHHTLYNQHLTFTQSQSHLELAVAQTDLAKCRDRVAQAEAHN
jgi:hypothetical protein